MWLDIVHDTNSDLGSVITVDRGLRGELESQPVLSEEVWPCVESHRRAWMPGYTLSCCFCKIVIFFFTNSSYTSYP